MSAAQDRLSEDLSQMLLERILSREVRPHEAFGAIFGLMGLILGILNDADRAVAIGQITDRMPSLAEKRAAEMRAMPTEH